MKTIYVLGSLNTDLVINADVLPKEGETLNGHDFRSGSGGKGLNQAIAASKLGADVKFCGAIGNDIFGKQMVETLKINKVNVVNVKTVENKSSGIAMIVLNNANNRIILDLGANLEIKNEDIDKFLKKANPKDIFVAQLENNIDAIKYALKVAKARDMITVLNPAPANKDIGSALMYVDYLIPNETEYDVLKDIIPVSTKLIITKGEKGCSYVSINEQFDGIAPKVNVVDTTGAGDCFVGAFAYMLSSDKKVTKEMLSEVTKIASISTTRLGSSSSSPTMEEVKNFKF